METQNIEIEEYIRGIKEYIPEPIKKAIKDDSYRTVTKNALATVNIYNEDLLDALSLETFIVLVGLQNISEFNTALEKNILLSGKGGEVAEEINKNLFTPLHSSFDEMYASVPFLSELDERSFGEGYIAEHITKENISELCEKIGKEKTEILTVCVFTLYTVRGLGDMTTGLTEYNQNIKDLYDFFNKQ